MFLLLMPLLVLTAAGVNVKRKFRHFIRRVRRRIHKWRGQHHHDEASEYAALPGQDAPAFRRQHSVEEATSKALRVAAVSIGLALVVAGPIVRTILVVDIFGFYVYAATTPQ